MQVVQRLWFELEEAFTAGLDAGDYTRTLEYAEVLGNGLAGDFGVVCQGGDRGGLTGTELSHQSETGFVAERGEDASLGFGFGGDTLSVFTRHGYRS